MEYKPEKSNEGSRNHDNGWIAGRIYFNKEDKRIIIKRPQSGFGYTVNLGNKWTWIFTAIILAILAAVIWLVFFNNVLIE